MWRRIDVKEILIFLWGLFYGIIINEYWRGYEAFKNKRKNGNKTPSNN